MGRVADKLAAARTRPIPPGAFGAEEHRFELGPPLPEAVVAEFEERHEVELPPAYRLFITELGADGAGPGYRFCRLDTACCADHGTGHLAQPSPYLPGPRYFGDWEQRHEDPPGPNQNYLRGTLQVAAHGCSLVTHLTVTGEARGRLINLDDEGPVGPYVVEDADFLAWYERWLDEAAAGYDTGWFGERLPLDEPELLAVLTDDPSPPRRARAGESLLHQPTLGDTAWNALLAAMTTDTDPTVRAELWDQLRWERHKHRRSLTDAEATADDIAQYARSSTPRDLNALATLSGLTFADVQSELGCDDLERRRRAAYQLTWSFGCRADVPQDPLDDVVTTLLDDEDPLLRSHGVAAVRRFGLTDFHPRLRALQQTEADNWVQYDIAWSLGEHPVGTWNDHADAAMPMQGYTDGPPF
ncbi:hypothetical protein [Actinomadura sp. LOL_011]|uniref:hypothetical protein n=1 Tax=Actinomadura sp. LOL_011 TaxID=3345410 RepID=UPI003A8092A7